MCAYDCSQKSLPESEYEYEYDLGSEVISARSFPGVGVT